MGPQQPVLVFAGLRQGPAQERRPRGIEPALAIRRYQGRKLPLPLRGRQIPPVQPLQPRLHPTMDHLHRAALVPGMEGRP
jgi:hypothetical protein